MNTTTCKTNYETTKGTFTTDYGLNYTSYGINAFIIENGIKTNLDEVNDISTDFDFVNELAKKFNEFDLHIEHFRDVIYDSVDI